MHRFRINFRGAALSPRAARFLFGGIGVAALVFQPTLAVAQDPSHSATSGTITVRGVVLTSSGHKPISGAAVEIDRDHSTLTDEQGRFVLPDVPPGIVAVGAIKAGYLCDVMLRVQPHPTCFTQVDLRGKDVDVTLTMLPEAVVRGHVMTAGRPAAELGVVLFQREIQDGRYTWKQTATGKTDAGGDYRIGQLEPGTYLLRTAAMVTFGHGYGYQATKDHGYEARWYPDSPDQEGARPIVLAAGDERQADMTVQQSFILINLPYTWKLPDEEGSMQYGMSGGASVDQVRPMVVHPGHLLQVYTPFGHYTFSLCIYPPAPGGNNQPWSNGTTQPYCGFSEFTVTGNTMSAPALALEQPVAIPVHVRAELTQAQSVNPHAPSRPAAATFVLTSPTRPAEAVAAADWTSTQPDAGLSFKNVRPGVYTVRTWRNGGVYPASLTCGSVNLLRDPLVVKADIPACSVEAVLRDNYASVTVSVSPQTLPGMTLGFYGSRVTFIPLSDPLQGTVFGGVFPRVPAMPAHLPPGRYLAFLSDGRTLAWREPDVQKHLMTLGKVLTVKAGEERSLTLDWSPELHDPQNARPAPGLGSLGALGTPGP